MTELVLFCGIMGPICGVITVFCLLELGIERIERAIDGRRLARPMAPDAYLPRAILIDDDGVITGAGE